MASTQEANGVKGNHKGEDEIQAALHDIGIPSEKFVADEGERRKALLAAYALVARLETPWEFVARFCLGQVSPPTSLPLHTLSAHVSIPLLIHFHHVFEKSERADKSLM